MIGWIEIFVQIIDIFHLQKLLELTIFVGSMLFGSTAPVTNCCSSLKLPSSLDQSRTRFQRTTNSHWDGLRIIVLPVTLIQTVGFPSPPLDDQDHSSPDARVENDVQQRVDQRRGFGETDSHGGHGNWDFVERQELSPHRNDAVRKPAQQGWPNHGKDDLKRKNWNLEKFGWNFGMKMHEESFFCCWLTVSRMNFSFCVCFSENITCIENDT